MSYKAKSHTLMHFTLVCTIMVGCSQKLDPKVITTKLDARQSKVELELKDRAKKLTDRIESTARTKNIELISQMMKSLPDESKDISDHLSPLVLELQAEIDSYSQYGSELPLDKYRANLGAVRKHLADLQEKMKAQSDSVRDASFDIDSAKEWQSTGIYVKNGDLVVVAAEGTWTVGPLAGRCNADGMSGHENDSYNSNFSHGGLLVASDDSVLGAGGGEFTATSTGKIKLRCNDRKYTNNSGQIRVRVLAITPAN